MNGKVVLRLKAIEQQPYTFTEPVVCTVGRAADCLVHLGESKVFASVSRHHCRLDIDPPTVVIRDLGSLNGTFVNGRNIGKRDAEAPPEDHSGAEMPGYPLNDGDVIRIGDVVLHVSIDQGEHEYSNEARDEADALVVC